MYESRFDAASLHISVLLGETLQAIAPKPGGRYLDGTLGLGGHSRAILQSAPDIELCGLDRDENALGAAAANLAEFSGRANLFHLPYAEFSEALGKLGWNEIDGALLDLGVSSMQIDTAERGFSFRHDGELDMRMDTSSGAKSARQLVNREHFVALKEIIASLGEEPQAGRIARAIIDAREKKEITTTLELAEIVYKAYPAAWRAKARNHPATRTFQALRMAVNDELGQLKIFLENILARLRPGGRLAIISFHSLEDRMVKTAMRSWAEGCRCPRQLPLCVCGHKPEARIIYKKPVIPGQEEMSANPRSASAKLRAAEKLHPEENDNL